jgi:hypothetical protein
MARILIVEDEPDTYERLVRDYSDHLTQPMIGF